MIRPRGSRAAAALLVVCGLGPVSGCVSGATSDPIEAKSAIGDYHLSPEMIETRRSVLETCNSGDGAERMRQDWVDYGFQEDSGKTWMEALTSVADFRYADHGNPGSGMRDFGIYTYPTVKFLADNCPETAFLLSRPASETFSVEAARPVLDAYRSERERFSDANETDTLASIANHLDASE